MPGLGRAALALALVLLLYALVAGAYAAWKGRRRLLESAQSALIAAFGATVVAATVLFLAMAFNDFSFRYAWEHICEWTSYFMNKNSHPTH